MLRRFDGKPVSGRLVNRRSEHSLDVEPRPERGVTSLLVNDVQIEIDEDARLIYVRGLFPHESWTPATLDTPTGKPRTYAVRRREPPPAKCVPDQLDQDAGDAKHSWIMPQCVPIVDPGISAIDVFRFASPCSAIARHAVYGHLDSISVPARSFSRYAVYAKLRSRCFPLVSASTPRASNT